MRLDMQKLLREGFIILVVYLLITLCLILYANRIERLEKRGFNSTKSGIVMNVSK